MTGLKAATGSQDCRKGRERKEKSSRISIRLFRSGEDAQKPEGAKGNDKSNASLTFRLSITAFFLASRAVLSTGRLPDYGRVCQMTKIIRPARKREESSPRTMMPMLLRFEMGLAGATSSEAERLEVKVVVIRELLPSYLAYIL